jgi:hypothetical protein
LECTDRTNEEEAIAFLKSIGASEVKIEFKETGWWLGRYDKETPLFDKKTELVH